MTYRQYLEQCDDEFEKTVIIANLARRCPNYEILSPNRKKQAQRKLLDAEMPKIEEVKS